MTSQETDRRQFLMTGDRFVDWRGDEFAVIERPRWSFRDLFRSSAQEVQVVSPDGTLLFRVPSQRTRDIDLLWIEDDSGARIATLRRTGREAMTANLFQATDAQAEPFGTIKGDPTYTAFEVTDSRNMPVGRVSTSGGMTTIQCPDDSERWRFLLMGLAIAAEVACELQAQRTP
ncbi:hypothetical protein [Actinomadura formosensis]|uniref:hypothetical protein n=1 Tax=Actinomadura formosensis TaxID=60706 RepID=UPI003D8F2715